MYWKSTNFNFIRAYVRYSLTEAGAETVLDAQVVATSEAACRAAELTGGKGSSLAVLHAIAEYLRENGNGREDEVCRIACTRSCVCF